MYDLWDDPHELINRYQGPGDAAIRATLTQMLVNFLLDMLPR